MSRDAKLKDFRDFRFDADDRWTKYLNSVELPAVTSIEAATAKLKAKWYKKNVDPEFEVDWASPTTASRPTPTAGPTPLSGTGSGVRPTPAAPPPQQASSSSNSYAGSGVYRAAPGGGLSRHQQRLLMIQVVMVVLGPIALMPLLPFSRMAYGWFLRSCLIASVYKVFIRHGLPPIRPWSALTAWAQHALPGQDLFNALTCLTFMSQPPMMLVAAPMWVAAAYDAVNGLAAAIGGSSLWQRYGRRVQSAMMAKQADAMFGVAAMEVGLGFTLVALLLTPQRSILTLFFYWNTLKIKYHLPDTAGYHRMAWQALDQATAPYRHRLPILDKAIAFAQRWFTSMPMQPQHRQ